MTTPHRALSSIARLATGMFIMASVALAQSSQNSQNLTQVGSPPAGSGAPGSSTSHAPEIDVALAGGALALVIGGVLIVTALRRRRLARV